MSTEIPDYVVGHKIHLVCYQIIQRGLTCTRKRHNNVTFQEVEEAMFPREFMNKNSLTLKWRKEHGSQESFFFIPWTKKLYLLLLIFNEMFPNVMVKNCSNVLMQQWSSVYLYFGCHVHSPQKLICSNMCNFQRMKPLVTFFYFPGGFLTIIVAVTPYYSNNCYISCDKFDSH